MQKILEVLHNSKASSFTLTKLDRSRLYGSKRRIPVDAQGQECLRATLTRDGKFILPNGGTAMLYLDEQGDVVERDQLQAIDPDGEVSKPGGLALNAALELGQAVEVSEVLNCTITHAYALEPVFLSAELEDSLSQGSIFRLPLTSSASGNNHRGFLLGNDAGYFLLIGERTGFEFIGLAEADVSLPELDGEDTEDDLDFGML